MEPSHLGIRPLPVAPRPFPDETLCSWTDRVGKWYAMSGSDMLRALCQGARLPPPLYSLEHYELNGETPRWATDLLADATRLPRAHIYAMRQDSFSRWTPSDSMWKVSTRYWRRRCWHCLADQGTLHDRRPWRSGWVSSCPEHHIVLNSTDHIPSPYAAQLEAALIAATYHPQGKVQLPWPLIGGAWSLFLPEVLATLAVLAEYLCGVSETVVSTDRLTLIETFEGPTDAACCLHLIDLARFYALGRDDAHRSFHHCQEGWHVHRGLNAIDHHALMASLGWLLSDWTGNLRCLLQSPREFSTPPLAASVAICEEANIKMLQERASHLMEPLRQTLGVL
ncbi:MAG: TniQ family protein [Phycisphaerales bacterium]|nr:TniQ family protein [Phycisphaerales bacterium]